MSSLLICEDEHDAIAALLSCLDAQEHDIQVVRQGRDVLEKSRSGRPDLILLNVAMSGLDGFAVCERLQAHPLTSGIPIIFLSGRAAIEDKLRGFAVGGVDYITKPFHAAEVRARVEVHLRLHARMQRAMCVANLRAVEFDPADDLQEKQFQRALSLLEDRLTHPPSMIELARTVGINDRKLTDLFRRRVGVTVFDYVSQRRLECGRQLLETSRLQVRQVADRLGYKNPGDFTRAFRRYYGIAPREFRHSTGNDADSHASGITSCRSI